jgi:hypothetical protein
VFVFVLGCGRLGFDTSSQVPSDGAPDTAVDAAPDASTHLQGYAFRKQITIGGLSDAELVDFTVNVTRTSDADLAARARPDGQDLVVTAADGVTILGYEVAAYNAIDGRLDLWIRFPTIPAAQGIGAYLYYGGPPNTPTTAWPSSTRGVWHMNVNEAVVPGSVGGFNGSQVTAALRPVSASAGIAGPAALYDGVDDTVGVSDPIGGALDFDAAQSFTYQAWVNVEASVNAFDTPFHKGGSDVATIGYDMELGTGPWEAGLSDGTINPVVAFGLDTQFVGQGWVQLVAVVDRTLQQFRAYANGVLGETADITALGSLANAFPLQLGRDNDVFKGMIDEVRVYDGVVPLFRLGAERVNFVQQATKVIVGPQEP